MNRARVPSALRRAAVAAILLVAALRASPAAACPRCFGASSDSSLLAYFATGALLSFLPLAIIGVVGLVIYRHSKKSAADSTLKRQG